MAIQSISKKVLTSAAALSMVASIAAPSTAAFAEEADAAAADEILSSLAATKIDKTYNFAQELDATADAEFTYSFEAMGYGVVAGSNSIVDLDTSVNTLRNMPAIADQKIDYDNLDNDQVLDEYNNSNLNQATGQVTWTGVDGNHKANADTHNTELTFDRFITAPTVSGGVTDWTNSTFKNAGVYEYKLTESKAAYKDQTASGETRVDNAGVKTTSDDSEYLVRFYVYNDGTINVTIEDEDGNKCDEAAFVNSYEKTTNLDIKKTIAGSLADMTLQFDYDVELTLPTPNSILKAGDTVTATESIDNVAHTFVVVDDNGTLKLQQAQNDPAILLGHNESLVFAENSLPVGTVYTVTENLSDLADGEGNLISGYTPSFALTGGAQEADSATSGSAAEDTDLSATGVNLIDEVTVGAQNAANYTNTYNTVTPTGIALSVLPYALVLALAGAGVVYGIRRARQSDED